MTIAEQLRQEGRQEAWQATGEEIALRMIEDGLDITAIVRYTELPLETVKRLKQNRRR